MGSLQSVVQRRKTLAAVGALGIVGAAGWLTRAWAGAAMAAERFEVEHTPAQWRALLTPEQYEILREEGTERPFTSPLNHEKRQGRFLCAGCGLPLFSSATKYDSGTGWPSFWQPLNHAVATHEDRSLGMVRTEVHCRRCGGHLGHVFDDGPQPTGLRYCMNGLALRFEPASLSRARGGIAALFALALSTAACGAQPVPWLPAPKLDEATPSRPATETAVFAGGCFWGVQAVYQHVKGVQSAVSGYAGGSAQNAQYETVSGGATGHAESVQVRFDPSVVSYGTLLRIFFSVVHDPRQLDRQGPDTGTQYRSEIFTLGDEQARVAAAYVRQLEASKAFGERIVTRIEPLPAFYAAEAYHQDFATRHPDHPYIVVNDLPKLRHLATVYPEFYREDPVLVTR